MKQGDMENRTENLANGEEKTEDKTENKTENRTKESLEKVEAKREESFEKPEDRTKESLEKLEGKRGEFLEKPENKTKESLEEVEAKRGESLEKSEDKKNEHLVKPEDKTEQKSGFTEEKVENNQAAASSLTDDWLEDKAGEKAPKEKRAEKDRKKKTEKKTEKKTAGKKKIWIPICALLALAVACSCVYCVVAFSYKEKFLPGTWVNGMDCSEMSGAQVAGLLENQLQVYYLDVTGRDYVSGDKEISLGRITADDIDLTYGISNRKAVDALLAQQDIFTWLFRRMSDNIYSFSLSQGVSYDNEQLKSIVNGWEACQPENMTEPQDAYISQYSEKLNGYEIIPEVEGTKFDVQSLLELMDVAILSQESFLDLELEGFYESPAVRQDDDSLTEIVETANRWLGARITYDWNGAEVIVDKELLRKWVALGKEGPVLDEAAVAEFVKEQAEEYDTYGKRRSFMTTLGVELSLPSGYYGWLTDQEAEIKELIKAIREGKTVTREPVYASTARQKGMSDIGNSYVEADLTHQHLYLYQGGSLIFETDFVSGSMSSTPDCVTPEGVFGLSYKTTNAVLRGADYVTPVNYWMPFYGNYGMHDATWRSEFGGGIYIENGSHGCLNLPLDSAATIYGYMSTGFPVICYYYQVDPLANQYVDNWDDDDDEE